MTTLLDTVDVRLTGDDVERASNVGRLRHVHSLRRGEKHRDGKDNQASGWNDHIEGAIAELVVAKYLGIPWSASVDTFRTQADVGPYDVRWASKSYGLIVRDRDKDERVHILVVGVGLVYTIVGWIWGWEARQIGELRDFQKRGHPVRCVAQRDLHPMTELPQGEKHGPQHIGDSDVCGW
jgi:hypothetical protein